MKKLKNFDRNFFDLIKDAHKWEYTSINDNKETSKNKKPRFYFTICQWILILLASLCTYLCPKGINIDFAGYIMSGMALFVGILFTLVVSLFDKFKSTDFNKYNYNVNKDMYPIGIRLKNYFKKTIILTLYTSIIALVSILMLAFAMMYEPMSKDLDIVIVDIFSNITFDKLIFIIKVLMLILFRISLFYFLLNFMYTTKQLISLFYDYMVNEIQKVNLK